MTLLVIRCDASRAMGLGHVMRTLALAEEARQRGIDVGYAVNGELGDALITALGFRVLNPASPDNAASPASGHAGEPGCEHWLAGTGAGDIVVFDGQQFGSRDFLSASGRGATVAAIDDVGNRPAGGHKGRPFPVDVIVNQNPATTDDYDVDRQTVLLLGPQYALVRREFRDRRRHRAGGTKRLLLTFGGTDATNVAPAIVHRLDHGRAFDEVVVIAGPGAAYDEELTRGRPWLQVIRPPGMADAFDQADAAVAAAGATTWELLCTGLPTALLQVVDNQRLVGPGAAAAGAALFLGRTDQALAIVSSVVGELARPSRQDELSARALAFVDGQGAERVMDALLSCRSR